MKGVRNIEEILLKNAQILSETTPAEDKMRPCDCGLVYPSVGALKDVVGLVQSVVFPDFFDTGYNSHNFRGHSIGVNIEKLFSLLQLEIGKAICFDRADKNYECGDKSSELASQFVDQLPEIKRLLLTDVEAMFNNDPAADNYAEVILSYPAIYAMTHYRTAHSLHKLGIPILPRIITELAHSVTGIDINPGAEIGEYFAIDHGTGVVIGETAIVGNHVTLYQGVTLGAKNFSYDSEGHPVNIPRHPILEDNVTVYSNSSILGRITVGHDSVIGGNIWLTNSVPPRSRILQRKAIENSFIDGLGI